MDTRWVSNLPKDKQEDFKALLRNSTMIFRRLKEILDDEEDTLIRQESSINDFDDSNWYCKQAFRNGDRSRIRKLRDLINFKEKGT